MNAASSDSIKGPRYRISSEEKATLDGTTVSLRNWPLGDGRILSGIGKLSVREFEGVGCVDLVVDDPPIQFVKDQGVTFLVPLNEQVKKRLIRQPDGTFLLNG